MLDRHCGDGNEWLRPYVYRHVTGNAALDRAIARLTMAFGIDHLVVGRGRPTDPARSLYCSTTAITRGKPAIAVESGSLGVSDEESVERIVTGIRGVLRELRMKEGGPEPPAQAVYLDPTAVVTGPETGILYSQVECGQTVPKGACWRTSPTSSARR